MQPVFVHHLRVIDANGHENAHEMVACPRIGRTQPLEGCWRCGSGHGVVCDDRFDALVVDCQLAPLEGTSALPDFSKRGDCSDARDLPVGAVMSRNVVCVRSESPLHFVRAAFVRHAVGAMPVLDAQDRPVGVISPVDLLDERRSAQTAGEVMTKEVMVVPEGWPLARAAAILAFEGIHHLIVKSEDGKVAGMLSSIDVCRYVGQKSGALVPRHTRRQGLPAE